ncbi:succinyldiaminopimelate transaminase [Actinoalloteichus hymeniacidonis]|uniref:Aminotransferase n=1 Tax=Actinoalloteichus hymeniacidonis TaxID=340345 RepID=A0AAC9MX03_9PSEU|nr:succinyldiaminopimelate transaminase [Actinoalloteichus hymeniacidonis]AOS61724.1 succinyldiaminopimelate aminotransferase apoenzyme [Actinoalloteichus hymeniacidonis]MBB5910258.1 succinyldiaminopimelate transaminase [Actinoalloteichus hymeniacidonis]
MSGSTIRRTPGDRLPEFPWDSLTEYRVLAETHAGGVVDLSIGTPVDPVPTPIQQALASVADQGGYPTTHGTAALRESVVGGLARRHGITDLSPSDVLPVIGSKELVAWLPTLLGLGSGDIVAIPELSYPTYEAGARLAGAEVVRLADGQAPPPGTALVWLNSPSNPTGRVLDVAALRAAVGAAREVGAVVASDECYLALGWEAEPRSVLDRDVVSDHTDVLAVHSLSKSANLAGYRAGFVTGDPALVQRLLATRKHAGMMVPRPVQAAMAAAMADDEHLVEQRARYAARRDLLAPALRAAGFAIEHSEAGLYLWATRGEDVWRSVSWFAERGILVAPGSFYGPAGAAHVRVALTGTDERIASAVERLSDSS